MSASAELFNQLRAEVGPVIETVPDFEEGLDLIRVVGSSERIAHELVEISGLFRRFGVKSLPTPDTQRFVFGGLLLAPGTFERRDVLLFGLFDLHTVEFSVLSVRRFPPEASDVSSGVVTATGPSLPVFDEGLGRALSCEPASIRLPEGSWSDGLIDACAFRWLLEHLEIAPIANPRAVGELAPQRCRARIAAWVLSQPAGNVRDAGDQVNRSLAGLTVDGDDVAGICVCDIADSQVFEFAPAQSSIKLEGDSGTVTGVVALVEHCLDFIVPCQHFRRVGHGVIARRQGRRDPAQRVGDFIIICQPLTEDADGNTVAVVRFRRLIEVILAVDPADDLLGSVPVVERLGDGDRTVFRHSNAMAEQLHMTIPGIRFSQQAESVGEFEQGFTIGVGSAALAGFDFLAEDFDLVLGVPRRHSLKANSGEIMNVWYTSRPRLSKQIRYWMT